MFTGLTCSSLLEVIQPLTHSLSMAVVYLHKRSLYITPLSYTPPELNVLYIMYVVLNSYTMVVSDIGSFICRRWELSLHSFQSDLPRQTGSGLEH